MMGVVCVCHAVLIIAHHLGDLAIDILRVWKQTHDTHLGGTAGLAPNRATLGVAMEFVKVTCVGEKKRFAV